MDQQLLAVMKWFPQSRTAIMELAMRDKNFRSLCADLTAAEKALHQWNESDLPVSVERTNEYRLLVAGLVAEVEVALGVPGPCQR